MTMDLAAIQALRFDDVQQHYAARDSILYALGLGYGDDPLDERQLRYVYEDGLRTVPSMCSTLCQPGFWARDPRFGIDWVKVLHAEQAFELMTLIPPAGSMHADIRIAGLEDKGADKGAMVHQIKELRLADGSPVARVRTTLFLRGNGGEGGFGATVEPAIALPDREPDRRVSIPTSPRSALIYRLSGDWNPLHADPAIARKAGFERPISHGLGTLGVATRAVLTAYCDDEPARLKALFVRFSRPVFPGETIQIDFFEEPDGVRFRAMSKERNIVVLDRCHARIGA
ncbi:MaoC/PaaZ C-terminal domain-containing protein [Sphingomonas sp.]|uniref:MaoC/PaaZ C-terminal domain-containing protein n=1 Tax=Sphingomonas sp. TaxID=28214 RepID=UPI001ED5E6B6|nr:MaoC/PaaZ C-terminal domain-containing protein [Sphingomonas sp.]MBX3595046.1 3-alpha,7-alpha,12-alpha-trihydroxy-5-beta-cholest-24-enoyl-CoA hydratase [Sphingomonas sp.]